MLSDFFDLTNLKAPYGANGSSGGGNGGSPPPDVEPFNFVKGTTLENDAAGGFFHQEAILEINDLKVGGYYANRIWIRSYYRGTHSSYAWLLPLPPFSNYRLSSAATFEVLSHRFKTKSPEVVALDMYDMTTVDSKKQLLEWMEAYKFDIEESVLDHYLDSDWRFLTSRFSSGMKNADDFYEFVNSTPVLVSDWSKQDSITYPMALTGSSRSRGQKNVSLRVYVVSDHKLLSNSHGLESLASGTVDYGGAYRNVSLFEARFSTSDMKSDLTFNFERGTPPY